MTCGAFGVSFFLPVLVFSSPHIYFFFCQQHYTHIDSVNHPGGYWSMWTTKDGCVLFLYILVFVYWLIYFYFSHSSIFWLSLLHIWVVGNIVKCVDSHSQVRVTFIMFWVFSLAFWQQIVCLFFSLYDSDILPKL